jgi:hypothetical protein
VIQQFIPEHQGHNTSQLLVIAMRRPTTARPVNQLVVEQAIRMEPAFKVPEIETEPKNGLL